MTPFRRSDTRLATAKKCVVFVLSLYRTWRAKKSLRQEQVPWVMGRSRRFGDDPFRCLGVRKLQPGGMERQHGLPGFSFLTREVDFPAIRDIPQDGMPARGELEADLVHSSGPEHDSDKAGGLPRRKRPPIDRIEFKLCDASPVDRRIRQFRFGHIGDLANPIGPLSSLGGFSKNPGEVFLVNAASSKLIAESPQGSLISRDHHHAAGHSIQPMRDADERFGRSVSQLIDQHRLHTRHTGDRLREQVDRLVDHQEPGIIDQDFDHGATQKKSEKHRPHVPRSECEWCISASRSDHVPLKCNLGQEG